MFNRISRNADPKNMLFRYLGEPFGADDRVGTSQWFSLCRELKYYGVLGPYANVIKRFAPLPVSRKVEAWVQAHRRSMEERLRMLQEFSERARREALHFVVIKGIGLSQIAFNDPFARQSGDIDLLVNADDVPKADWILRSLGWRQPGEARLVRPMQEDGTLTEETLDDLEVPYPLRSNIILPHVTNYYKQSSAGFESIELHDRFHGINAQQAQALLWEEGSRDIGKTNLQTLGHAAALIVSGLSLHEDSETVRANTAERGTMGVKACVDIHSLLDQMNANELARSARLVEAFDARDKLAAAFSNASELFQDDEHKLQMVVGGTLRSPWSTSYLERIRDPRKRAMQGICDVRSAMANRGFATRDEAWAFLQSSTSSLVNSFFKIRTKRKASGVCVEWRLPAKVVPNADCLVLQATTISRSGPMLGFRGNVFLEDGRWCGILQEMAPNTVDGHANKIRRGMPLEVSSATNLDDSIVVTAQMPNAAEVFPSVWHKIYGQLHSRIAGPDFAALAEDAMTAQGGRCDEDA